ncbi:MAG TPA: DUF2878 domain-containing protein [Marinobacter sp.]|uniref:DUF2878 domain-containing protein n=3 Tax=root TaxID=1 RepID=A0A831R0D0_9GAMM|nr:DUF2878 domain-containing protein [Marinobacter antarcticus]HDZ37311.1 DUF2878 domain-containing protein [Marinobacter sp.]HEA50798.1 DUF2878 domain-containing protein [Marinobacter antarcticus]
MIASETARNILNFILFQIGWFACAAYPTLLGPVLVLVFLAIHFVFVSQHRFTELQFVGLGTVVGALLDGLWFYLGVLDDGSGTVLITPLWLVAIWAIFMTTLSHSLNWISRKMFLAFLFAPIAGPFAYWSASKIGVVVLPDLVASLIALGLGWLVVFPLLLFARKSLYPELT